MTPDEAATLIEERYLVCPNCHRQGRVTLPHVVKLPVNGGHWDLAAAVCQCGHVALFAKDKE